MKKFSYPLLLTILILTTPFTSCRRLASQNVGDQDRPALFKTACVKRAGGCPCLASASRSGASRVITRVFHAEGARGLSAPRNGLRKIGIRGKTCYYPEKDLKPMKYAPVLRSALQEKLDHRPRALNGFVAWPGGVRKSLNDRKNFPRVAMGRFWPTYYHLALEDFYPGPETDIINGRGQKLGRASSEFLKQTMWQGSGIGKTGLRLHYTGRPGRFNLYPRGMWGHGAGHGYRVYPYRTIAVNFKGFCKKMGGRIKVCNKRNVIGQMVYIPAIARAKVVIPGTGGQVHDGYFCATDTGSPYYIRADRIDMFVGVHGGGNPFLPPARRKNYLYDAGFKSLLPSDWRLWRDEKTRVWCPVSRLPRNPFRPGLKDCIHDYHAVAPEKSFQIEAVFRRDGKPLRCRKG